LGEIAGGLIVCYWTPKNYDGGGGGGVLTLRRALENSRNLATVHLLDGGIEKKLDCCCCVLPGNAFLSYLAPSAEPAKAITLPALRRRKKIGCIP